MNLVFSLLVLGGGALAVWGGIVNPPGGIFQGIGRALRGEAATPTATTATPAAFLSDLAALAGGQAGRRRTKVRKPGSVPGVVDATPRGAGAGSYSLGAVKPWVRSAAYRVGPMFGIRTIYGVGARTHASDHPDGLALDFMTDRKSVV